MSKVATIADAEQYGACYKIDELKKVFGRRKSLSIKQIAALKIPVADKVWALSRFHFLDTHDKAVRFSIFCAEQCIDHYESKYPEDKRPRNAIDAAKAFAENPTEENKNAANAAAANAAAAAAYGEKYAYEIKKDSPPPPPTPPRIKSERRN